VYGLGQGRSVVAIESRLYGFRFYGLDQSVRAVRRSASTPPILVSRTTSLSPRGTLLPAACAESITGLLSANTHALASALYYPHTPQLHSTRYILHTQYAPVLANPFRT